VLHANLGHLAVYTRRDHLEAGSQQVGLGVGEPDADGAPQTMDLRVGFACRPGATGPDGPALCAVLLAALLLRRRSARR
jgi:hypothetical protein